MRIYEFKLNNTVHFVNKKGREIEMLLHVEYAFVYKIENSYKTLRLGDLDNTVNYDFIVYRRVKDKTFNQEWKEVGRTKQIKVIRGR